MLKITLMYLLYLKYEGKLHFAALSALRNFSIPSKIYYIMPLFLKTVTTTPFVFFFSIGELRLDLFSMGVADVAIHCLKNSSFPHIHFKALGILRLLIQKQSKKFYC